MSLKAVSSLMSCRLHQMQSQGGRRRHCSLPALMGQRQSPAVWFLVPDVPSYPKPYPECCSVTQVTPQPFLWLRCCPAYSPHSACRDGDRKFTLNGRPLLANLPGGITEAFVQQGGKVCSPSSATLRPRSLWADGWGFYSMGVASRLPSSPTPASG